MAGEEQYLSFEEVLGQLGVDRDRLNGLIQAGRLTGRLVAGQTKYSLSEVTALKQDLSASPTMPGGAQQAPGEDEDIEVWAEEEPEFELEAPPGVEEAELARPLSGEATASESALETDLEIETEGVELEAAPEAEQPAAEEEDVFDFSDALEADFQLEGDDVQLQDETLVAEPVEGVETAEEVPSLVEDEDEEIITAILETDTGEIADDELLSELVGAEQEEIPVAEEVIEEVPLADDEEVTADLTPVEEEDAVFEPMDLDEELAVVEPLEEEFEPQYEAPLVAVEESAGAWPTVVLILALLVLALGGIFMIENGSRPEFTTHLTSWLPF